MNPVELARQCVDRINGAAEIGIPAKEAAILLVTPKGWKVPVPFPRRRIVRWNEDGSQVCYVNALRLLAWLAAIGAVQVKTLENGKERWEVRS